MHLLATTLLSLLVPATPAFAANEPETNAKRLALGLSAFACRPTVVIRTFALAHRASAAAHMERTKVQTLPDGPSVDTSGHVQGPSARTMAHTASTTLEATIRYAPGSLTPFDITTLFRAPEPKLWTYVPRFTARYANTRVRGQERYITNTVPVRSHAYLPHCSARALPTAGTFADTTSHVDDQCSGCPDCDDDRSFHGEVVITRASYTLVGKDQTALSAGYWY
ncbi:hypothetical protein B0H14DRAFT_3519046 [Mycena olivaceomarginata]|nr:hypothetical protein B0H14DRAFT_3519046 [Mycena olivaceomarginata]